MELPIESVNIINLKRRTDLEIAQRAVWGAMGASPNQIVFHEAMDGRDYKSKQDIIHAARANGFDFFQETDDIETHWTGLGEYACLWSISRLLRHITEQSSGIYLYVLADRFSKVRLPRLEKIFNELPDFMFFQFKGHVPAWGELDREGIKGNYPRESITFDELVVEYGNLKHGDGVLAMTPGGARWMQSLVPKHNFPTPYEIMLWWEGIGAPDHKHICPEGVYSAPCAEYEFEDASSLWEGEFAYPLAGWHASDIGQANKESETGVYRNPNAAYTEGYLNEDS